MLKFVAGHGAVP